MNPITVHGNVEMHFRNNHSIIQVPLETFLAFMVRSSGGGAEKWAQGGWNFQVPPETITEHKFVELLKVESFLLYLDSL